MCHDLCSPESQARCLVVQDAGLLCAPTENVRITDEKAGSEIVPIVGKIVGANIQVIASSIVSLPSLTFPVAQAYKDG